jgi:hypothetical protein
MIVSFWLVVSTPLKNMKVSWDYYSQYMESHKSHIPNQQPALKRIYTHYLKEPASLQKRAMA